VADRDLQRAERCEHHNADPVHKQNIQRGGEMPQIKCEGELP
jgi:hypothetical protein